MSGEPKRWPVVILGCGYAGQRVAAQFLQRGHRVFVTTRNADRLAHLRSGGASVFQFEATAVPIGFDWVPQDARLVYSIPPVDGPAPDPTPKIVEALGKRVSRVVYLSTTGVYGTLADVDENTPAAPRDESGLRRIRAEDAVRAAPWSSTVLRPAAIYGPGRGVHVRVAEGTFRLVADGRNFVSRIHVEDLAAIVAAALDSSLEGVWPVADQHPCTTMEIAEYCARLLGVSMPESAGPEQVHRTRRANRRVNGSAVLRQLGLSLRYPSYRDGIPASLNPEEYRRL